MADMMTSGHQIRPSNGAQVTRTGKSARNIADVLILAGIRVVLVKAEYR